MTLLKDIADSNGDFLVKYLPRPIKISLIGIHELEYTNWFHYFYSKTRCYQQMTPFYYPTQISEVLYS